MKEDLNEYDNFISKSARQRKAAYKAWKTMRAKGRLASANNNLKIDGYLTLKQVSEIIHPETFDNTDDTATTYGKGIVTLFQKTPADIACGKFWEVRWAYGCPLDCNYCYLRGTMKGRMKPSPIRTQFVLKALDEAFERIQTPSLFNSGELSDSLMYPSLMQKIVDKFEEQNKHKIVLLSKMGVRNIDFLLQKYRKQTICAWSINAPEVAKRWEQAAAIPAERIAAAKMVSEIGYDTRIRIDPIFPIDNWKTHYGELIYSLLSEFEPKRIILGTPRGLWKTIKYAQDAKIDMSWAQYFREDSSWGKKIAFDRRKEIYQFFLDKLDSIGYDRRKVTMCKETVAMWKELDIPYTPLTCNCYGKTAFS